ncbi:MAG: site-2 protease family protein, partial [Pseudomonadota bacterium]
MLKDILLHVTDFMYGIVGFILLMSIVVFIHEFGHYYAARLCNVRVEIFSIGFGKKAFSFIDRAGCQWAISYLPIGGYVKFFGDKSGASNADNDVLDAMTEEDKKVSFHFKNLWQKIFIVAAGPLANFILCFVILWGLFFFRGVGHSDPYIMDVLPDMPAAEAGLKRGDKILTIDGFAIESVQQSRTELIKTFGRTTNIEILRGDDVKIFLLTPVMREMQGQEIPVVG